MICRSLFGIAALLVAGGEGTSLAAAAGAPAVSPAAPGTTPAEPAAVVPVHPRGVNKDDPAFKKNYGKVAVAYATPGTKLAGAPLPAATSSRLTIPGRGTPRATPMHSSAGSLGLSSAAMAT